MDIATTILEFITNNKAIIVGAVVTLSEVNVVIWNMLKRMKAKSVASMSMNGESPKTTFKDFLWSANPINLFRKG